MTRDEYPRPDFQRDRWVNLNGEWEFGAGLTPVFDRRIEVPFCPQSRLSGIQVHPGDVVWYRKRFDAPEGEVTHLHFGAVDYRATVWVNDVEVGSHEGGHVPFTMDISRTLRPHSNVLVVKAEDPLRDRTIPRGKQFWGEQPEGIFYTPTTGIWQTVWLEPLPARRVRGFRLRPRLAEGAVDFEAFAEGRLEVTARLGGGVVGQWSGAAAHGRLRLDEIAPWRPDSPRLYDLEVRLLGTDGGELDRAVTYCGLRSVETRDGRFWLNGEPFVQRLILDQGYFPDGLLTAPRDEDLRRDIELAKSLGFNGARKHQKVEDPRWLYWADRLGFLVWSEMPSFHEHSPEAERRLAAEWREVVARDRGHPSIVAWVIANESFGLDGLDPAVRSGFLAGLYRATHDLDGLRPVISNDGWQHALSDICTIHDYSGQEELTRRYRTIESALTSTIEGRPVYDQGYGYRGEPVIVSEFGGLRVAGPGGWGWLEVHDEAAFIDTFGQLVEGLLDTGPVEGYCYTQLTDVEQEQNGLLSAARTPKVEAGEIRALNQTPKRRGAEFAS